MLIILPIYPVQLPGDFSASCFHSVSSNIIQIFSFKHPLSNFWVCLAPPWFLGLPFLPGRLLHATTCVILTVQALSAYHPAALEWLV